MALPTTRTEFKAYCLRSLGDGVLQINVSDQQVEDRIDYALSKFADFHYDGTETFYLKHQLTETDITNKYISVSENIMGIVDLFPIGMSYSSSQLFNIRYQFALNDLYNLTNFDLASYTMTREYISLIEETLIGKQPFRFNRHTDRLYIDMNWDKVSVGEYIIAKCYQIVDGDTYPDVWGDRWLIDYASCLIKHQWASNLSKFEGVQLPGGVTLNGINMLQEAKEEKEKLEQQLIDTYSLPAADFIG